MKDFKEVVKSSRRQKEESQVSGCPGGGSEEVMMFEGGVGRLLEEGQGASWLWRRSRWTRRMWERRRKEQVSKSDS